MTHATKELLHSDDNLAANAVTSDEVRKALSAILQSPPFRSSKQLQKLLQFIVSETLAGRSDKLKERIIGATVFDRRPDYDTNDDPTVRLRVAELRKRLALYYQASGEEPVVIAVPSGSFKAVFEWPGTDASQGSPSLPQAHEGTRPSKPDLIEIAELDPAPTSERIRSRKWWAGIGALVVMVAILVLYRLPSPEERAIAKFWSPILSANMALIYIGNNPVYDLSPYFVDEYFKKHPQTQDEETGPNTYIPAPPEITDPAKDLVAAKDTYVTNGDLAATSQIVSLLARRSKPFDLRYGSDVAYGDVRQNPTILIGAHNNYWTLRASKNLRVGFDGLDGIADRTDPTKRWAANSDRTEDYALVSRVMNSWSGKVVIIIAGVGQGGTRAAAEFITNPQAISKLVKSLPKGWENKNVQVVLHTRVRNQIPSPPDIVAAYAW